MTDKMLMILFPCKNCSITMNFNGYIPGEFYCINCGEKYKGEDVVDFSYKK